MSESAAQARDLLSRFPLIDGHNDLPWTLRDRTAPADLAGPVEGTHTDLPRLAAAIAVLDDAGAGAMLGLAAGVLTGVIAAVAYRRLIFTRGPVRGDLVSSW